MSVLSEHVEQTKQKTGTGLPPLPRVNLLPPEIGERVRFRRIQYGLGGGVLAAAGLVAALLVLAAGGVADANREVETATAAGATLEGEKAKYRDVEAVYAQAAAAQGMLSQAMGEEIKFSKHLYDLGLTVPGNVWLTNATFKQAAAPPGAGSTVPGVGAVTFSGIGFKHDDVAAFLDSLAKQPYHANPYFTSSTLALIGTRKTVSFSSTVTLTQEALSGDPRYTASAGG